MTTSSPRSWRLERSCGGLWAALTALLAVTSCVAAVPPAGPAAYEATLWPQRPEVSLGLDVAPDLHTATGHESVVFTPDLPTCEMVFRNWPNAPTSQRAGNSLTVTGAALDGAPATPRVEPAGAPAGAPGTLVSIPLPRCLQPGQSIRADLDFAVTLGEGAGERVGTDPVTRTAWAASAFPLLAWVRGSGWIRDLALDAYGETSTSEDFALALEVTAPSPMQVNGTGSARGTAPGPRPGTTVHRFEAPAVRDVAIAVGDFDLRQREIDGVLVHVATPRSGTRTDPEQWLDEAGRAISTLSSTYGPFPYRDLWLTITPARGADGNEYPQALQLTDARPDKVPALITHEVGHQWFYSLVGNDQARDPWLDEAFAAFGEQITGVSDYSDSLDSAQGDTGRPLSWFVDHGGTDAYNRAVYEQGAAALAAARQQVGDDAFDADLRNYLRANAHRVASPADVQRAFADQPAVLDRLRQVGALPDAR